MRNHQLQSYRCEILRQTTSTERDAISNQSPGVRSRTHLFSALLADQYGYRAAIILRHLGNKVLRRQHHSRKTYWFYVHIAEIAWVYPYFSRSTVAEVLNQLVDVGVLLNGDPNKEGYAGPNWYAFKHPDLVRETCRHKISFDVQEATAHGVVEAVLLQHLRLWIAKHREFTPSYRWRGQSAAELATYLPFSKSRINRALNRLAATGVLVRRKWHRHNQSFQYAFVESNFQIRPREVRILLPEYAVLLPPLVHSVKR